MITKDMQLMEVMHSYPEAKDIFDKHGMGCVQCMGAMTETIEKGAQMHSVNLDDLLEELYQMFSSKSKDN